MSDWSGITGSGAGPATACPAREAFPGCHDTGERAERGNVLHDFAKKVTIKPDSRSQALLDIDDDEWRATAMGMNLEAALYGLKVKGCEVAFVLDVKNYSCRLIGHDIDRKYEEHLAATGQAPLSKYEIPFTVDVWAETEEDAIPVELDYKSGQYIGDPTEHMQRRLSSAGVMFYADGVEAISRVAYIHNDGSIEPDGAPFYYADAIETCDTLARTIDRVEAARVMFQSGVMPEVYPNRDEQCRYCSAFDVCPYWTSLAKAASGKLRAITEGPDLSTLSLEVLGRVLDETKDILKVATELEGRLKAFVYKTPLPVDDKTEFRSELRKGKSYFDAAAARGLLVTLMGRLGDSEEEIDRKMRGLNKIGADYSEIRKRKRELPLLKATG